MANLQEFTDANFETEVLKADKPVLVDFWAPWCGPCRQLTPVVEELSLEYASSVKVGKLNIDDSPKSASAYGVMSIPTLIVFKNGQVADHMVGAQPKKRLQAMLDKAVG